MENCIFCDIIEKNIPSKTVYEDDDVLVVEDINPQSPVHLLVLPKKHIPTVLDVTQEDHELIGKMVQLAGELAKKNGIGKKGFRLLFNCMNDGGQTVYHLHMHLLGGRRMMWPPG